MADEFFTIQFFFINVGLRKEMPEQANNRDCILALINVLVCIICGFGPNPRNTVFPHERPTTMNMKLRNVLHQRRLVHIGA